ncbi:hypothetical protein GGQ60_001067 [Pedobacter zeae]|uniref:Uncharacterized protein n=1 Tax=Pedobacter zeae TaxID=1737356 RepID=A0A7W6P4L8_9SPHI|nr:hypothetical protein [Pedobacter zeae]
MEAKYEYAFIKITCFADMTNGLLKAKKFSGINAENF